MYIQGRTLDSYDPYSFHFDFLVDDLIQETRPERNMEPVDEEDEDEEENE